LTESSSSSSGSIVNNNNNDSITDAFLYTALSVLTQVDLVVYVLIWVAFTCTMTRNGMTCIRASFFSSSDSKSNNNNCNKVRRRYVFVLGVCFLVGIVLGAFGAWSAVDVYLNFPIPFKPIMTTVTIDLALCYLMLWCFDLGGRRRRSNNNNNSNSNSNNDEEIESESEYDGDGDDDDDNISGDNTRNLTAQLRQYMDPGNLELSLDAMAYELEEYDKSDKSSRTKRGRIPDGGISAVDVLVCTPGRLVDHLDNTPGFTLQHLRWLVIDEADRLLSQSYHGWIQRVLDCVHTPPAPSIDSDDNSANKNNSRDCRNNKITIDPVTYRRSEQDAFVTTTNTTEEGTSTDSNNICQRIQLRKLLYSATLTKDPQKLSSLRLINPKYFNAHDLKRRSSTGVNNNKESSLYRMPEQLKEYTVECTTEQKPIVLLALLLEKLKEHEESATSFLNKKKKKKLIVVFTSSLESTHRLTRLLQLLFAANNYGTPPAEFSSALNQHQRSQLMNRCNDPNDLSVSVLICSDGMSRGMDLASVVAVIHYDVPVMAKTYVHRCGRTARAGQDGTAIAILKGKGQAGQFARLRRLIALPEGVTKASVKTSLVRDALPLYKDCVSCLREVLAAEDRNELKPMNPDLSLWLPSSIRKQQQQNGEVDHSSDSDSSSDTSSAISMSISST